MINKGWIENFLCNQFIKVFSLDIVCKFGGGFEIFVSLHGVLGYSHLFTSSVSASHAQKKWKMRLGRYYILMYYGWSSFEVILTWC